MMLRPACRWEDPVGVVQFLERWSGERLMGSGQLDSLLARALWDLAEGQLDNFSEGPDCLRALKVALAWLRRECPRLMAPVELRWILRCGGPGDIRLSRGGAWGSPSREPIVGGWLLKSCAMLERVRDARGGGVLECSRASSRSVRRGMSGLVFPVSVECRAGLVSHLPFLRELIDRGVGTLRVPSRDRLGRSAWRGCRSVLGAAGVRVTFDRDGGGVDAAGRTRVFRRLLSGSQLAGVVVLPGWLGIGQRLGRVGLVRGGGVGCLRRVAPGDDVRAEHHLLRWALEGVRAPIRLLPPVSGRSLTLPGDR